MSSELAMTNNHATMPLDTTRMALLKRTIAKGCTDDELELFGQVCKRTGLDPFSRQIYAVRRYDKRANGEIMSIQTSIDGFRLIAERSGKYAGQLGPFWCGDDAQWVEVWLNSNPPRAAKVGILRGDFKEPIWSVATWDQYAQMYFDKQANGYKLSPMWAKMGPTMIAKCAESLGLRRAFPNELSGLYTGEEMAQADNAEPVDPPPPVRETPAKPKPATTTKTTARADIRKQLADAIDAWSGVKAEDRKAAQRQTFEVIKAELKFGEKPTDEDFAAALAWVGKQTENKVEWTALMTLGGAQ